MQIITLRFVWGRGTEPQSAVVVSPHPWNSDGPGNKSWEPLAFFGNALSTRLALSEKAI